jgi:hypothetical protein
MRLRLDHFFEEPKREAILAASARRKIKTKVKTICGRP